VKVKVSETAPRAAAKGDKFRQLPVTKGDKLRQVRCRLLPRDFRLCFFLPDSVGVGVSKKIKAFKFQKAVKNHVRLNVSNWVIMGAVNVRF